MHSQQEAKTGNIMTSLVLVFAKTPTLGSVKTRLAKTVGDEKALWVYLQLLKKTDAILQSIGVKVIVFYDGLDRSAFGSIFQSFQKFPQEGATLGERMHNAFQWGFSKGYDHIVIIGTDLWSLDQNLIEQAFTVLKKSEIVIGPAKDGGYYLLGKKQLIPTVFKNKNWSSSTVLKETVKDLKGYKVGFLEEKMDIDQYEDILLFEDLMMLMRQHFDERKN